MYPKNYLLSLISSLLVVSAMIHPALAERGRPHIDSSKGYNILLSDKDTLLRGVSLSWDGGDPYGRIPLVMPSQESLNALVEVYGFNTLHVYLEGDSVGNTDPVGTNAEQCDILVERCAKAGLYLVLTIGCNGHNGHINSMQFCIDFWDFYGPRYKDRTHVFYEAKNEPVAYTCGHWSDEDLDRQITLYKTMRAAAPDTLLLLCSYQGLNNPDAASYAVKYLDRRGVDWSNAGIAWHGYTSPDAIVEVLDRFEESTDYPATLCTEFFPGDTTIQGYNSIFESHFVGWTQFEWLGANNAELVGCEWALNQAGTGWIPDNPTSTWPAKGTPRIPENGSSVGIFSRGAGKFISADSMNRFRIKADRARFTGKRSEQFVVETVAPGVVSLKASNGSYLSVARETEPLRANAKEVGDTEKFLWMELPNGDVALRSCATGRLLSTAGSSGRATERVWANALNGTTATSHFVLVSGPGPHAAPPAPVSRATPAPGPYYGTPAPLPGVIQAEDFDYGGEGIGYHDTEEANLARFYRPAEGVDIEHCNDDWGCSIAWIQPGEWMQYTVTVATPGTYALVTRYAGGSGTFHFEFGNGNKTSTVSVPDSGGWQEWKDAPAATISLPAGVHTMRFVSQGGFNINKFTCLPTADAPRNNATARNM